MNYVFGSIVWHVGYTVCLLMLIIFCASLLCVYRVLHIKKVVALLSSYQLRSRMFINYWPTLLIMRALFMIASMVCCLLALMRPQWGVSDEKMISYGRDIYVALDISRSMLAQDLLPNRLEAAKQKIKALIDRLPSERVGLVVFAGAACVLCPLTEDRKAFFLFLDSVDAHSMTAGKTALSEAIIHAKNAFERLSERKNKLLLLFTDGEDFSHDLPAAYEQAIKSGILIFTVGMATPEGAPIPIVDEKKGIQGYQKDKDGTVVISRLNSELLTTLASKSKGIYVPARYDVRDIDTIVSVIESIEREEADSHTVVQGLQEQYWYFAAVAFGFLAGAWLI